MSTMVRRFHTLVATRPDRLELKKLWNSNLMTFEKSGALQKEPPVTMFGSMIPSLLKTALALSVSMFYRVHKLDLTFPPAIHCSAVGDHRPVSIFINPIFLLSSCVSLTPSVTGNIRPMPPMVSTPPLGISQCDRQLERSQIRHP